MISENEDMTYYLLTKKTTPLAAKQIARILQPAFSPTGSNRCIQEEVMTNNQCQNTLDKISNNTTLLYI